MAFGDKLNTTIDIGSISYQNLASPTPFGIDTYIIDDFSAVTMGYTNSTITGFSLIEYSLSNGVKYVYKEYPPNAYLNGIIYGDTFVFYDDSNYLYAIVYTFKTSSSDPIYVYRIRKDDYSLDTKIALPTNSGSLSFSFPVKPSVKDANHIYFADYNQSSIFVFDAETMSITERFGVLGDGVNEFKNPSAVYYKDKYIYIADYSNSRIAVYNDDFEWITFISTPFKPQDVLVNDYNIITTGVISPTSVSTSVILNAYDVNDFSLKDSSEVHIDGTYSLSDSTYFYSSLNKDKYNNNDKVYITTIINSAGHLYLNTVDVSTEDNYSSLNMPLNNSIDSFNIDCNMNLKTFPDMWASNLNITPSLLEANLNSFNIKESLDLKIEISGYNERISSSPNIPFDISIISQQEYLPQLTMPLDIDIGINTMLVYMPLELNSQINTVSEIDFTFDILGKSATSVELLFNTLDIGQYFGIGGTFGVIWNTADLIIKSDDDLFHNTQFEVYGIGYSTNTYKVNLDLNLELKSLSNYSNNNSNLRIHLSLTGEAIGNAYTTSITDTISFDMYIFGVMSDGYLYC